MSIVTNNIMNRYKGKIAEKKVTLPLNIQKLFPVNAEIAKVVLLIPDAIQRRANDAELASSFDEIGLRYLPNSLARCHMENTELFTGFVSTKRIVMSDETASTHSLVEVASNVFTDDNDNVWDRIEVDGKSVFVCTANDDVSEILKGHRSSTVATASVEVASSTNLSKGDVVMYYDTTLEVAAFGIATGINGGVYVPATDKITDVPSIMVLAAQKGFEVASFGSDEVLDFYRKLYGENAEFFGKMQDLVKSYLTV